MDTEKAIKKPDPPSAGLLFVAWLGYVTIRAVDRVFMKRVTATMESPAYNLMLWNVIYPFSRQVVQVGFWGTYIAVMRYQGHKEYTWKFLFPGNPLATSGGPIPVYILGLFSLGDQICNCLGGPAAAFISQTMLGVFNNMGIVFTMPLSALVIGTRYFQVHYAGAILVILSVMVGLSAKLSAADCSPEGTQAGHCLAAYKASDGTYKEVAGGSLVLWYGVFMLSILPFAIGGVYKQWVLQGRDVEVVYATWWSGVFQILWGILLVPFLWIKMPGQYVAPGETFTALGNAFSCLCGNVPQPGDEACATSPVPFFWFFIYLFFCVSYQVLVVWLTKYLSAVWVMVAAVLCLDLTNVLSMVPFLAGGSSAVMSVNDWLATILASVAIWVYSMQKEYTPPPKDYGNECIYGTQDDEDSTASESPDERLRS
eukprot:TRINITY_DN37154_c0_g1_i2.p1 TRINITY_DN37154_c0_g1~~TRINITY_DN37154_c0_g1_i2.p1  ORF type:complete len:426 (-),score=46.50 TRINITY_DN37154_c0_g1_i2:136-1413(-)